MASVIDLIRSGDPAKRQQFIIDVFVDTCGDMIQGCSIVRDDYCLFIDAFSNHQFPGL